MKNDHIFMKNDGFTFVEIIMMVVMLAVPASMAIQRLIDLGADVKQRTIDTAILKLNSGRVFNLGGPKKLLLIPMMMTKNFLEAVDYNRR